MASGSPSHDIQIAVQGLISEGFAARSPAMLDLLSYLAQRAADPQAGQTTEYMIAQDVLGRDGSFDPQADPVVRVRIKRLRDALAAHYEHHPAPRQLVLPTRSYDLDLVEAPAPIVDPAPEPAAGGPHGLLRRSMMLLAGAAVAAAAVIAVSWVTAPPVDSGYPLIRILPIQNLTRDESADLFETGLQRQIATDLQRFSRVRVYVATPPTRDIDDADYTLRGSLLSIHDKVDLAFRLEREIDGALVYSERVEGALLGTDYYEAIAELSSQVSGQIAGQGGPTSQHIAEDFAISTAGLLSGTGVTQDTFRCLVLTDRFFNDYDVDTFLQAYRCFEFARSGFEQDAFAMSRWGTLAFHTVPEFDLMQTELLPDRIRWSAQAAYAFAVETVERHPSSSDAYLLLGSVQNAMGELAKAELSLRQAINLNPGDPTARAVLAYLLLSQGKWGDTIASAHEAISLSAQPQGYIYLPIALAAIAIDDRDLAIEAGEAYVTKRSGDGAMTIRLLVARLRGDSDLAEHLSGEVAALENPVAGFSRFIQQPALRDALQDLLPEVDLTIEP